MTAPTAREEEIARIVAPDRWMVFDSIGPLGEYDPLELDRQLIIAPSIAKARQIIALSSSVAPATAEQLYEADIGPGSWVGVIPRRRAICEDEAAASLGENHEKPIEWDCSCGGDISADIHANGCPEADLDREWIPWPGGKHRPVGPDVRVFCRYRDGFESIGYLSNRAGDLNWEHFTPDHRPATDIIAYRIAKTIPGNELRDRILQKMATPSSDMTEDLAEKLYVAFWTRNESPMGFPPWPSQAIAIRKMWTNIAADALATLQP